MRIPTALAAAIVIIGQMTVPVWADTPFNRTTILGWCKQASGAAMAYFSVPMQATRAGGAQPRLGLMIAGRMRFHVALRHI